MTRILFVCHGNICRSPMAEFVMKDLAEKAGILSETDFMTLSEKDVMDKLEMSLSGLTRQSHSQRDPRVKPEDDIIYLI